MHPLASLHKHHAFRDFDHDHVADPGIHSARPTLLKFVIQDPYARRVGLRRTQCVVVNPLGLVLIGFFGAGGLCFFLAVPFVHGSREAPFIAAGVAAFNWIIAVTLWKKTTALIRVDAIRVSWPRSEWIPFEQIARITTTNNGAAMTISAHRNDGSAAQIANCSFGWITRLLVEDRVWDSVRRIRLQTGHAEVSDRLRFS